MKIRSGFVSNSSTSSFVILGVKMKKTGDEMEELTRKHKDLYAEFDDNNNEFIVGYKVARWSDDSVPAEVNKPILELSERAEKALAPLGIKADQIRLFVGSHYS
jgi:hypothetical protein